MVAIQMFPIGIKIAYEALTHRGDQQEFPARVELLSIEDADVTAPGRRDCQAQRQGID